jgi:hypothetical protein
LSDDKKSKPKNEPPGAPHGAPPDQTAFCERCAKVVPLDEPKQLRTNTGKPYIEGRCRVCASVLIAIPLPNAR